MQRARSEVSDMAEETLAQPFALVQVDQFRHLVFVVLTQLQSLYRCVEQSQVTSAVV